MSLLIGSHVSFLSSTGLLGSVKEALSYGSNTFMFYTGAPQNTKRSPISMDLVNEAKKLMEENDIDMSTVVVHAPYIVNLANMVGTLKYNFAVSFLKQEIDRCEMIGVKLLVLHPGNYLNMGVETGINNIVSALNEVIDPNQNVYICIETMAGKGTEVGRELSELKSILDGVKHNKKIKFCLDSCHLNDSGVDMKNFNDYLDEFDRIIGIEKIGVFHINDSKNNRGDKKDRHENIGLGTLGFDTLINVIYNDRLKEVPKILETPYITKTDEEKKRLYPPYKHEIEMIRKKEFNSHLIQDIRGYYN